jgi:hypothetical protein
MFIVSHSVEKKNAEVFDVKRHGTYACSYQRTFKRLMS